MNGKNKIAMESKHIKNSKSIILQLYGLIRSLFIRAHKTSDDGGTVAKYADTSWHNITSDFKDDVIIDIVSMNSYATYQLSESGRVYSWGSKKYLGIGSANSSNLFFYIANKSSP